METGTVKFQRLGDVRTSTSDNVPSMLVRSDEGRFRRADFVPEARSFEINLQVDYNIQSAHHEEVPAGQIIFFPWARS
jgi:hypothetical protein